MSKPKYDTDKQTSSADETKSSESLENTLTPGSSEDISEESTEDPGQNAGESTEGSQSSDKSQDSKQKTDEPINETEASEESEESNVTISVESSENPGQTIEPAEIGPDLKKLAGEYFKHNQVDTIFITSDLTGFTRKPDALLHARELENHVYLTIKKISKA
jgi:hypothetical protein